MMCDPCLISQWVPTGNELKHEHGTLHTSVLVWVSYFQKDDGQKLIKKHTNKDTRVSTQCQYVP